MAGPGDETAAVASHGGGRFRASHADREQVIGTLKAAFVQGRLSTDELDARADRVYASRTYAELAEVTAEVTADIPVEPVRSRRPRDPWRATKLAWRIEYAVFLPGIVGFLLTPGGPHTTLADGIVLTAVMYVIFWALGAYMLLNSRRQR
jgi:Domain of unknown function (DUF1707)